MTADPGLLARRIDVFSDQLAETRRGLDQLAEASDRAQQHTEEMLRSAAAAVAETAHRAEDALWAVGQSKSHAHALSADLQTEQERSTAASDHINGAGGLVGQQRAVWRANLNRARSERARLQAQAASAPDRDGAVRALTCWQEYESCCLAALADCDRAAERLAQAS